MRELLYEAYLRFPRAFYDLHPTGQVVSRATNDLYPIRYFIGWGMVQGAQSVMMLVGAGIVLVATEPSLALWSALPLPLHRARGVALRAPRDADLARGAAAQGRRDRVGQRGRRRHRDGAGVRPRGRRAAPLRRARGRGPDRGPAPGAGRVPPPAGPLLPAVAVRRGRALPRRSRRDRRDADLRRVRALHPAAAAARLAARVDGLDHQPRPARARLGGPLVRVARPRAVPAGARAPAARCRERPLGVELRDVHFAYPGGEAGAARRRPDGRARRGARDLRRDRRGQVDAARARPALLRPHRRRRPARRPRPARARRRRRARAPPRSSPSARSCSPRPCATTCSPAGPTRRGRRSSAPARSRA